MRNTLIALTAAAAFGIGGFAAAPATAASIVPAPLGVAAQQGGVQIELAQYSSRHRSVHRHRHVHRHVHRNFARRHFWAPGPWAFRGVAPHNCYRIAGGYVCYY